MTKTELESKVKEELKKVMTSPRYGFPEDEYEDYCKVEIYEDPEDKDYTIVEVRAEVSYDGLEGIGDALNPIIASIDKDAYFEPYTSGITRAYIQSNKLKQEDDMDSILKRLKENHATPAMIVSPEDFNIKPYSREADDFLDKLAMTVRGLLDKSIDLDDYGLDGDTSREDKSLIFRGNVFRTEFKNGRPEEIALGSDEQSNLIDAIESRILMPDDTEDYSYTKRVDFSGIRLSIYLYQNNERW